MSHVHEELFYDRVWRSTGLLARKPLVAKLGVPWVRFDVQLDAANPPE